MTLSKTKFKDCLNDSYGFQLDQADEIEEYFSDVFVQNTLPNIVNMHLFHAIAT